MRGPPPSTSRQSGEGGSLGCSATAGGVKIPSVTGWHRLMVKDARCIMGTGPGPGLTR